MALPGLTPGVPLFDREIELPRTTAELRAWVIEHFDVSGDHAAELIRAINSVVAVGAVDRGIGGGGDAG